MEKVIIHVIVFKHILYAAALAKPLALAAETNMEAVLISLHMLLLMLTSVH